MKDSFSKKKRIATLLSFIERKITEARESIIAIARHQKALENQLQSLRIEKQNLSFDTGTQNSNYIRAAFEYNLVLNQKINDLNTNGRLLRHEKNKKNEALRKLIMKKIAIKNLLEKTIKEIDDATEKQETQVAQGMVLRNNKRFS